MSNISPDALRSLLHASPQMKGVLKSLLYQRGYDPGLMVENLNSKVNQTYDPQSDSQLLDSILNSKHENYPSNNAFSNYVSDITDNPNKKYAPEMTGDTYNSASQAADVFDPNGDFRSIDYISGFPDGFENITEWIPDERVMDVFNSWDITAGPIPNELRKRATNLANANMYAGLDDLATKYLG